MPAFIVFVRFFSQYSKSFPFERFAPLMGDDLKDAFTSFYEEQKRADPDYSVKCPIALQRRLEVVNETEHGPQNAPPEMARGDLIDGMSHFFPVAPFATQQGANNAKAALQMSVAELARSTDGKSPWTKQDYFFATANPWFFVKSEGELPDSKAIWARTSIARLSNPSERPPTPEEAALRYYLPMIKDILEDVARSESDLAQSAEGRPGTLCRKGKRIDEQMQKCLRESPEMCTRLSKRQWAQKLGCGPSTIQDSATWKQIITARKLEEAARVRYGDEFGRSDRRRRGCTMRSDW